MTARWIGALWLLAAALGASPAFPAAPAPDGDDAAPAPKGMACARVQATRIR
ncbi:MAG: hypothetical protein H6Q85_2098 [candidate division NC10 bacterium]|jgi:hypothetical protein|nr:hypothetical protein [candidate division NC10 bacterium]